jgi:pyruvate formate lyase activating enzyme
MKMSDTLHTEKYKPLTRRRFLERCARGSTLFIAAASLPLFSLSSHDASARDKSEKKSKPHRGGSSSREQVPSGGSIPPREAMYYKRLNLGRVQCELCFRECIIYDGERGECRNRENRNGTLYNLVYAKPSAIQIDPIEKEPQHHMLPGTNILCFGTAGCNFKCRFCQNWHLSQRSLDDMEYHYVLSPAGAVTMARERAIPTISFTYNEPTSFYEWVYDIARLARDAGLHILWHSNGAMNPGPLENLLQYTDAVTIDLKGFREQVYTRYSSAELEPVLRSLRIIRERGIWLEIVNLVVPTVNDDPDDMKRMCRWIVQTLGPDVPLHFSRFFPAYRLTDLAPTPVETLERAYRIARECEVHFVTVGNVPGHRHNSTFCPSCGSLLIRRIHFQVLENHLRGGRCPSCGRSIPGLWAA